MTVSPYLGDWNLVESAPQYDYDAWNRLAGYDTDVTVNASRYEYPYDALHRRAIEYKYVDYGSQLPQDPEVARVDLYYSHRWQVIEDASEHSGLNSADSVATVNTYVWSPGYVDDLVLRDRKVTIIEGENGSEEQERLYAQHDHNFNVTSLTDVAGDFAQRFVYDPYGAATVLTSNYQLTTNNYSWLYLHQGGRQNEINGLYSFRYRELNSSLGRWMQQDPAGYVDGASLYQAVVSNPVGWVDPSGLQYVHGQHHQGLGTYQEGPYISDGGVGVMQLPGSFIPDTIPDPNPPPYNPRPDTPYTPSSWTPGGMFEAGFHGAAGGVPGGGFGIAVGGLLAAGSYNYWQLGKWYVGNYWYWHDRVGIFWSR